jgi:chemotaxis protein CheZ
VLGQQAGRLGNEWQRFRDRELTVADFRSLASNLSGFLGQVESDSGQLQGRLSEVLMAQGFQDLTGQIIRKVISLVQDVEDKLVQIIRLSRGRIPEAASGPDQVKVVGGPVVPGVDQGDVVQGQDEVDDLLSSLGF